MYTDKAQLVAGHEAYKAYLKGAQVRPSFWGNSLHLELGSNGQPRYGGSGATFARIHSAADSVAYKQLKDCAGKWWVIAPAPKPESKPKHHRGQWYAARVNGFVAIKTMSDEHLSNALSWMEIKRKEIEAEQASRVKPPAPEPVTYKGAAAIMQALLEGKRLLQKSFAKLLPGSGYEIKDGKVQYFDKPINSWMLATDHCFATFSGSSLFVEVAK